MAWSSLRAIPVVITTSCPVSFDLYINLLNDPEVSSPEVAQGEKGGYAEIQV